MEYYNGQLCISARELIGNVMSKPSYDQMAWKNKKITVARPGKGAGNYALVVVDSLPEKYKEKVNELYPGAGKMRLMEWVQQNYTLDSEARSFYSGFSFPNGDLLKADKVNEYTINASVIRCVMRLKNNATALRQATKEGAIQWDELSEVIACCKENFGHTLPESTLRFRKKVSEFNRNGYTALISGKFMNQNTRKVNYKIERLLLSLDSLPQRPFNTTVWEMYNQFVCGELDVYDPQTGELYNPEEYGDKNGDPIALSETTVANYLNNPKNRVLRSKLHDTHWDFNNRYRPHHNRKPPVWAFSKISLDDRDLPRKMPDGNRVKAYYAYDVASGCVIGYAYNRLKTTTLFLDCVRNMFKLIEYNGWNCPAEVEVEHHLVRNFADGLIRAGVVFPFVRWCNPGNSQEKYAEILNRSKKYSIEKRSQIGIGRWYARLEANRPRIEKVYDEKNNTYKEREYSYEQLVADDICSINEYNNAMHPNQTMYPGLTRWDVLCDNQNPDLQPVDKALLYRFIGEKTKTSICRSMYCKVKGKKYILPNPELIERLVPRDYDVQAYYMPDKNGNISEVYVYQDDNFIATCSMINSYNTAAIERTEQDERSCQEQSEYLAKFDSMVKRQAIEKVAILPRLEDNDSPEVVETMATPIDQDSLLDNFDMLDYAAMAQTDL